VAHRGDGSEVGRVFIIPPDPWLGGEGRRLCRPKEGRGNLGWWDVAAHSHPSVVGEKYGTIERDR